MNSQQLPISVIMLTFNEEANIARSLATVQDWAGEILVIDSGSTDRTTEIAQEYATKVFSHEFINYASQRNWAQHNLPLAYDWVMHLDADEQVSPELAQSICATFSGNLQGIDGFLINRRAVFLGHWIKHGGIYPTYHLRLFRHAKGYCEERHYDQHFRVDGVVQKLYGDIIDNVSTDLRRWTLSHERWASAEMKEYFRHYQHIAGNEKQVLARFWGTPIERRRWLRQEVYSRTPLFVRPLIYFIVRYFLLLGFLDGTAGLIFHFLQGFWFRFYVDAKIWEEKQNRVRRKRELYPDVHSNGPSDKEDIVA